MIIAPEEGGGQRKICRSVAEFGGQLGVLSGASVSLWCQQRVCRCNSGH